MINSPTIRTAPAGWERTEEHLLRVDSTPETLPQARGLDAKGFSKAIVIQTVTGRERVVECALNQLARTPYLPRYQKHRAICDYGKRVEDQALFPSYLFSEPLDPDTWLRLKTILGVKLRIRNVGWIDSAVLAEIASRESQEGYVRLYDFRQGEPIQGLTGAFRELIGAFSRRVDDRIEVLYQFMGKVVPVEYHESQIVRRAALRLAEVQ